MEMEEVEKEIEAQKRIVMARLDQTIVRFSIHKRVSFGNVNMSAEPLFDCAQGLNIYFRNIIPIESFSLFVTNIKPEVISSRVFIFRTHRSMRWLLSGSTHEVG